ncbi:hypothetical protein Pmani_015574 [Petrolisthes manimaculis]|uniref:Heparan sulfate 2-O-sulfotransferase pipe n=1 Tax=Petrolisthes manimaculis TaxID=1843537 RepID=A0AAE1U791_9EUCA|nr:hypothetical protein Pmani_015574 [Petrolisthes manimaculis]
MDLLFFNRVPKTGSEMLVLLLQWLQGYNTFRHIRLKNSVKRHLTYTQQKKLAQEVREKLQESSVDVSRVSFDRHVHFTNFTSLGLNTMPVYLNLIRDPVEKMASRFYYARVTPPPGAATPSGYHPPPQPPYTTLEECVNNQGSQCTYITGQQYDLTIPYFCGHQQFCRELNSESALRQAQHNVEAWYAVVGVLEDINSTLTVLHHKLPQFFYGVTDIYYNELLAPHHNKNWNRPKTTPQVEEVLKRNLTLEYEFYNFIRQRLNLQYQHIQTTQH